MEDDKEPTPFMVPPEVEDTEGYIEMCSRIATMFFECVEKEAEKTKGSGHPLRGDHVMSALAAVIGTTMASQNNWTPAVFAVAVFAALEHTNPKWEHKLDLAMRDAIERGDSEEGSMVGMKVINEVLRVVQSLGIGEDLLVPSLITIAAAMAQQTGSSRKRAVDRFKESFDLAKDAIVSEKKAWNTPTKH